MAENQLFTQLCSPEVMRVGWHLAQVDSRDDFVTDPIGHADFASNLPHRLQHLIEQVQSHRYRPRHLLEVDIPKSGLSVRPGNVLPIEEAALLHAIVYLLAPLLDKKLDAAVYSYRLHPDWKKRVKKRGALFRETDIELPFLKKGTVRSINPFEAWYERWPEFEKEARQAYRDEGYTHLTKTDITSYFENIDLRLLEIQIRSLLRREEGKIIQLLFRLLEGWTRVTSTGTSIGRGIPQGNDVSSFLGNLYLIPLDRALIRFCRKRNAKWFRYVDDVKVFTKSERDAREVVFVINEALRSLHLNLQGSKTEILSGDDLERELDNSDMEKVDGAYEGVQKLLSTKPVDGTKITSQLKPLQPLASRFRRRLPQSIKNLDSQSTRLFRRLMTVYGLCGRPRLEKAALAALKELPDLRVLKKALSYLSQLNYKTHGDILDEIMSLVEADEFPFPYQVGEVLGAIARLHPMNPDNVASRIRRYALIRKREWVIVQKAIEAIMTYPYSAKYVKNISERYLVYEHPLIRRAACTLLVRSPKPHARKRLSELIHHPDHSLSNLALYFWHFLQDDQFSMEELGRIKAGSKADWVFLRTLPRLYAIAATDSANVAKELNGYLKSHSISKSAKVNRHIEYLKDATDWAF